MMNLLESIGYKSIERSALSWWVAKSTKENLAIELHCAIAGPAIGSAIGTAIVFMIL
ncbi:hypothetical protein HII17_00590 [Thalassotalea sp. M1531]|uniref:Uncharacterized protein n=1 Tax=Thalassotalea algicola TaxID=2716224 RepID=A0A7Y0L8R8_9GAMM|nr:hypothetical protein [Thalassotalea algicola]NMP30043.1 hypothetical protein [Thalassotalea algicola]